MDIEDKLKEDYLYLLSLEDKDITYNMCKICVERNGFMLYYTPERFRDKTICNIAFEENRLAYKYTPNNIRTNDMKLKFIKEYGENYVEDILSLINPFFNMTFNLPYEFYSYKKK
jgi:hypothetical protein